MTDSPGLPAQRRRFLVSGLSLFGSAFALGSAAALSGCGEDVGPKQAAADSTDMTKTPDGLESMKASRAKYDAQKKK
jgi:hypothetical protein